MGYIMKFYTDGGCRGNGRSGATGAAAAVLEKKFGGTTWWTRSLPGYPTPTNQRAEITGIILALEKALDRYESLDTRPYLQLTICTDSKYAIGCMTEWIYKWTENGWTNTRGCEVVNRDLIEKASRLDDKAASLGSVRYEWVPRGENEQADHLCNKDLDEQEGNYYSSSESGW